MKNLIYILLGILFSFLIFEFSLADSDSSQEAPLKKPEDVSSANYEKAKKLLPGEEVVTPTGQKLKVWTTEGPVPVSKAPEPFEDREKSVINGANIVIDADRQRNKSRDNNR